LAKDPHHTEPMGSTIHEPYYHPDSVAYEPGCRQRVERAIACMTGRGCRPVFYGEGFLGALAGAKEREEGGNRNYKARLPPSLLYREGYFSNTTTSYSSNRGTTTCVRPCLSTCNGSV
jgi:hypothetical protein